MKFEESPCFKTFARLRLTFPGFLNQKDLLFCVNRVKKLVIQHDLFFIIDAQKFLNEAQSNLISLDTATPVNSILIVQASNHLKRLRI